MTGVSTVIACGDPKSTKGIGKDTTEDTTKDVSSVKDLTTSLNDTYSVASGKFRWDFIYKLIVELQKQSPAITNDNMDIYNENGENLSDKDIKTTFKVELWINGKGVTGKKVITVTWSEEKNISKLLGDTFTVESPRYIADFKVRLITELMKQVPEFWSYDMKISKENEELELADLVALPIKIKAVEGKYYEGEKIITV